MTIVPINIHFQAFLMSFRKSKTCHSLHHHRTQNPLLNSHLTTSPLHSPLPPSQTNSSASQSPLRPAPDYPCHVSRRNALRGFPYPVLHCQRVCPARSCRASARAGLSVLGWRRIPEGYLVRGRRGSGSLALRGGQ